MRYFFLLIAGAVFSVTADAQVKNGAAVGGPGVVAAEQLNQDWHRSAMSSGEFAKLGPNVEGSPYFNEEYKDGYLVIRGQLFSKKVTLRFDIYDNEIQVRRDTMDMVFGATAPVSEFGYGAMIFRRGYPGGGVRSEKTFYEVIASGRLSLLKLHAKVIANKTNMSHVPYKSIEDAESWYVYDSAAKAMISFKPNRRSVSEALPAEAVQIESVLKAQNIRLKDDRDWKKLFDILNS